MNNEEKTKIDDVAGAGTSDKIEGGAKVIQGRVEKAAGDLTGDGSLKREGAKNEAEGKLQHTLGEVKEKAEELLDKAKDALHKH